MVVVMPVVDVVVIRRLLRLVDDRRRCTVFGGAETRSLRLRPPNGELAPRRVG